MFNPSQRHSRLSSATITDSIYLEHKTIDQPSTSRKWYKRAFSKSYHKRSSDSHPKSVSSDDTFISINSDITAVSSGQAATPDLTNSTIVVEQEEEPTPKNHTYHSNRTSRSGRVISKPSLTYDTYDRYERVNSVGTVLSAVSIRYIETQQLQQTAYHRAIIQHQKNYRDLVSDPSKIATPVPSQQLVQRPVWEESEKDEGTVFPESESESESGVQVRVEKVRFPEKQKVKPVSIKSEKSTRSSSAFANLMFRSSSIFQSSRSHKNSIFSAKSPMSSRSSSIAVPQDRIATIREGQLPTERMSSKDSSSKKKNSKTAETNRVDRSLSYLETSEQERIEYFDATQFMFLQLTHSTKNKLAINYAEEITVSKHLLNQKPIPPPPKVITIDDILLRLRAVHESLLAVPVTEFNKQVHIYTIMVAAVYGHCQTYTLSFLTLINDVLPELYETLHLDNYFRNDAEFQRVSTIYIYHLVHYANDPVEAFNLLGQYFSPESPLYEFVGCWTDKDYFQWRQAFDNERDPALHRIMAFGELTMAKEALRRVNSSSYTCMDQQELEHNLGKKWTVTAKTLGYEWRRDERNVYIKRID